MNVQKQHALIIALFFVFSLSTPAFASKDRDFSDNKSSSPDPVVQTTSSPKENKGESVEKKGLGDHQADFKKEGTKKDPVVRNDGHKVPQPSRGEHIKSDSKMAPVTESEKKDPVVRNDGHKVPQPSHGDPITSEKVEPVN